MAQLDIQGPSSSRVEAMEQAPPMITRRFGGGEALIRRPTISSPDLAGRCHAVVGKWARTARRFRLDAVYSETLLASLVVIDLMQTKSVMQHAGRNPQQQQALAEMVRVLWPGEMVFFCVTRLSFFGARVPLLSRIWAITEQERIVRLNASQLVDVGYQPVRLGSAGFARTAFWAWRPL